MSKEYIVTYVREYLSRCEFTMPGNEKAIALNFPMSPFIRRDSSLSVVFSKRNKGIKDSPGAFTLSTIVKFINTRNDINDIDNNVPFPSQILRDQYRIYLDIIVLFLSQKISPLMFTKQVSDDIHFKEKGTSRYLLALSPFQVYTVASGSFPLRKIEEVSKDLTMLMSTRLETADKLKNAFHWYEVSITRKEPADALITAFAGIEVVMNVYPLKKDPIFKELYQKIIDVISNSDDRDSDECISFLKKRKGNILMPSLKRRFGEFIKSVNSMGVTQEIRAFNIVYEIRNDLLHGRIDKVPDMSLVDFSQDSFANPVISTQTLLFRCILYALKNWPLS